MRRAIRNLIYATPARPLIWPEPRFVIIGTGRSGTGYISTLLTEAGIRTGHEQWWNPWDGHASGLKGDASWCATFLLDDYTGTIFHQVRDPIKVVSSLARVDADPNQVDKPHGQMRARWIDFTGNPVVDAMTIADTWIAKAEQVAHHTYRLEDLTPELIAHLMSAARFDIPITDIEDAFSAVPSSVNTKNHLPGEPVAWDDLPNNETKSRLLAHAEKYGYF